MVQIDHVKVSSNHTLTLTGIFTKVTHSELISLQLTMQNVPSSNNMVENPKITIHNSSFGSLGLLSGTEAVLTECYIDSEFNTKPTLITAKNSKVTMHNSHLSQLVNENGPTLLNGTEMCSVYINNSTVINNHALHGIINLSNNCTIDIWDSHFTNNIAYKFAYSPLTLVHGVNLTMTNSEFKNNLASKGGVIWADQNCSVQSFSTGFMGNRAKNGGVFYINENSELLMVNNTVVQNKAIIILNLLKKIQSRSIPSQVLLDQFSQDGSTYDIDIVPAGGAVYVEFSTTTIQNSTFKANGAFGGAAVFGRYNSSLYIDNCAFLNNTVRIMGGAIMLSIGVYCSVKDSILIGNKAQDDGGGGACGRFNSTLDLLNVTFKENCSPDGGAVYMLKDAKLLVRDSNFTDNAALQNAGAIYLTDRVWSNISDAYFSRNKATESGAIHLEDNVKSYMINVVLDNNEATETDGGAIYTTRDVYLDMYLCHCNINSAFSSGGCIYGGFSVNIQVRNSMLVENIARRGGAIDLRQNTTVHVTGSQLIKNTGRVRAGAIDLHENVRCDISDSTFGENRAAKAGAILLEDRVYANMNNVQFYNNSASKMIGGALLIKTLVSLGISACRFVNNYARSLGGGLAGTVDVTAHVENSIFSGNYAYDGGAVAMQDNATLQVRKLNFTQQ